MSLTEIPAADFNLAMTLDSGQVFHWQKVGHGFVGVIGECARLRRAAGECLECEHGGRSSRDAGRAARQGIVLAGVRLSSCAIGRALLRA